MTATSPLTHPELYTKNKRIGLRKAINEKCKDCIYDPQGKGTWKYQTENCPDSQCPLFEVRPRYSGKPRPLKK